MFYRWEDPYSNWELDFKQCSFDRAVRILHHLPFNIFRISMLFSHALVPLCLSTSGKRDDPRISFQILPDCVRDTQTASRGAREQDPDRWCSHAAWGQEAWQIISQWVWNIRLELGHQLEPMPARTTEFAPALPSGSSQATTRPASSAPASGYGPPTTATSWKAGRFSGQDFARQLDGTLRCPAD